MKMNIGTATSRNICMAMYVRLARTGSAWGLHKDDEKGGDTANRKNQRQSSQQEQNKAAEKNYGQPLWAKL